MAKFLTLLCPACSREFRYMRHPSTDTSMPRFCPYCAYDSETEVAEIIPIPFRRAITAPHIAKSIGMVADATYRGMEQQAEHMIDQAAEMTGLDRSEFNDMKITDLKSNMRPGDIAAIDPPPSEVSKLMDQNPSAFGYQGGNAAAFGEAVRTGPHPYAGLKTAIATNDHFRKNAGQIIAAKTTGKF